MGTRFRIELYFPVEKLELALIALASVAYIPEHEPVGLTLPNGRRVRFPMAYFFPPEHTDIRIEGRLSLDSALLFPIDEVIQTYMDDLDEGAKTVSMEVPLAQDVIVVRNGKPCFPVGLLHLSVQAGKRYAVVAIGAVVSSQNRMLRDSPSVHWTLLDVLKQTDGVAGLIDVETQQYFLLTDTSKHIELNLEEFDDGEDVDGLTEHIISVLPEV